MKVKFSKDWYTGVQTLTARTTRGESLDVEHAKWLTKSHWYLLPLHYESTGNEIVFQYDATSTTSLHDVLRQVVPGDQYAGLLLAVLSVMEQCEAQRLPLTYVQWDPKRIRISSQNQPLFMVIPALGVEPDRHSATTLLALLSDDKKTRISGDAAQEYQRALAGLIGQVQTVSAEVLHDLLAHLMPASVKPRAVQEQTAKIPSEQGDVADGTEFGATRFGDTLLGATRLGSTLLSSDNVSTSTVPADSAPSSVSEDDGQDGSTVLSSLAHRSMPSERPVLSEGILPSEGPALPEPSSSTQAEMTDQQHAGSASGSESEEAQPQQHQQFGEIPDAEKSAAVTPMQWPGVERETAPAVSSATPTTPAAPTIPAATVEAPSIPQRTVFRRSIADERASARAIAQPPLRKPVKPAFDDFDESDNEGETILRPSTKQTVGFTVTRLRDGKSVTVHGAHATIGRSKTADIHMGGNTNVSRIHAVIDMLDDGRFSITDNHSANGTEVGGRELAEGGREYLPSGGDFTLADDTFVVTLLQ
ncbi:FHA domain-containing protein [Bifidobacterium olomucense]|uniref:FHA domain-containing protein n=1 Tax=Bifidobacterium olomucense TaxID=2675324 RepID=A0A7Y0EYM0_9BIFI|nr:FHA domain-containing protein [Bifidobacterium sp. DSM 109959]NMM98815.1 hypothetical protein [Bifidobacterium sp. DSM 109959]